MPASIAAGVDVCCFSGDKLLGGPQAGIIAGGAAIVDRIRTHPLMRALRVDKMTYAALEATLAEYAAGRAAATMPVQRMLTMTADEIRARAEALAGAIAKIGGWRAEIVQGVSAVGGGSAPGVELPTWLVAIERDGLTPDALERAAAHAVAADHRADRARSRAARSSNSAAREDTALATSARDRLSASSQLRFRFRSLIRFVRTARGP